MSFVRKALPVLALTLLTSGTFAARADDAAEKARKKLEKKEIRFRAKEFIEAVEDAEMDVIDLFLTAVKEHVKDDDARERIALAVLARVPEEQALRADEPGH